MKPIDKESYRRWYYQVGELRDYAIELAATNKRCRRIISEMEKTEQSLESELDDFDIPLTGREVMDLLGIEEGPDIGNALQYLREIRFQEGPITRQVAEEAIQKWWNHSRGN